MDGKDLIPTLANLMAFFYVGWFRFLSGFCRCTMSSPLINHSPTTTISSCSGNGKFFRPGKKFLRPSADDDEDDDEDSSEEEEEQPEEDNDEPPRPPPRVMYRGGKSLSRPAPAADSDDDDNEDDDDSEEEEEDKQPSRIMPRGGGKSLGVRPPAASANLSSDDDDSDEEEEEEQAKKGRKQVESEDDDDDNDDDDDLEDEEEEEDTRKRKKGSRGGKKSKRSKTSSFFDEEAEDDDDDEDDDPYGTHRDPDDVVRKHYTEEDIRKEQMDEEAQEIIKQQDRRRAQAGYRFGGNDSREHDRTVQDMAREIEERHRMSRRKVDRSVLERRVRVDEPEDDTPGGPEVYTAVSQQSLVPSVSDPSFWMVSCSNGKEQEMVMHIMNKCVAFARQGRPLGICGAIAAQTKGRIYVESFSEPAVVEAISGVRGLLQYTMRLVPIQDMTTVMTVVPTKKPGMNSSSFDTHHCHRFSWC
jgi:transcription elongation factor SPT5